MVLVRAIILHCGRRAVIVHAYVAITIVIHGVRHNNARSAISNHHGAKILACQARRVGGRRRTGWRDYCAAGCIAAIAGIMVEQAVSQTGADAGGWEDVW